MDYLFRWWIACSGMLLALAYGPCVYYCILLPSTATRDRALALVHDLTENSLITFPCRGTPGQASSIHITVQLTILSILIGKHRDRTSMFAGCSHPVHHPPGLSKRTTLPLQETVIDTGRPAPGTSLDGDSLRERRLLGPILQLDRLSLLG